MLRRIPRHDPVTPSMSIIPAPERTLVQSSIAVHFSPSFPTEDATKQDFGNGVRAGTPGSQVPSSTSSGLASEGTKPSSFEELLAEPDCPPSSLASCPQLRSCRGRSMKELMAKQLAAAQKSLLATHQQAVGILSECMDSAWKVAKAEAKELQEENSRLRSELAAATADPRGSAWTSAGPAREAAQPPGAQPAERAPAHRAAESNSSGREHTVANQLTTMQFLKEECGAVGRMSQMSTPVPVLSSSISDRPRNLSTVSTGLFPDPQLMKAQIRQTIARPVYEVTTYYHTEGLCQRIARSSKFDYLTLFIIAFNSIWIGLDADYNRVVVGDPAPRVYVVMEHLFCFFFTVEWCIRFMAFKQKTSALRDNWFVFDSFLVCLSILESWVLRVVVAIIAATAVDLDSGQDKSSNKVLSDTSILQLIRLLKLARMMRMARLFRAFPELMIMMKGLMAAIRSVMVTLLMLTVILYVFGVAFTELMTNTPTGTLYFNSVLDSMNTLLLHGVFLEEIPEVFKRVGRESVLYGAIFLLFVLIASFLVVNMLIGVMVETVRVVSTVEREQLSVNFTKDKLLHMLQSTDLDQNRDNKISKTEFCELLRIPEAVRALQELGVDVVGLVDIAEYVFEKSEQLEFPEFMEMVLELRGSNKATVKDIVDLRKCTRQEIYKVCLMLEDSERHKHCWH